MDNFSRLPDELTLRIISLVPLKDAVRTSILSSRWRYLYASMSNLVVNFDEISSEEVIPINVMSIVDRFFYFRNGRCPIDEFNLGSSVCKMLDILHIQVWIQVAMWHGIRNLILTIPHTMRLPSSLCTCKTLEVLKVQVRYFSSNESESIVPNLETPAKVCLPSLKVLELEDVIFSDDDALNRLIANCPVLEEIECGLCTGDCNLNISSPTLKRVTIYFPDSLNWSGRLKILINTPNIVYLGYLVLGVASQTFENLKSLTSAIISFSNCDLSSSINDAIYFMRAISNIHTLLIHGNDIYDIHYHSIPVPKFHYVTHLTVLGGDCSLGALLDFLDQCVSLETLVFEYDFTCDLDDWNPSEESRVICLSSRLKTIEIYSFKGKECEMKMVEFFLNSAKCLLTMKIDFDCEFEGKFEISKRVMMFLRASTKCVVVLD